MLSEEEGTEVEHLLLELWYHDNGCIIAKHDALLKAVEVLSSREAKRLGLHPSIPKCKIWWPTVPPALAKNTYAPEMLQEYSDGTAVLNAPIGSKVFMEK